MSMPWRQSDNTRFLGSSDNSPIKHEDSSIDELKINYDIRGKLIKEIAKNFNYQL